MRNQPIRVKIILAFIAVSICVSGILLIQAYYTQRKSETNQFVNELERYKTLVLNDAKTQTDFISIDLISDAYFLTESSVRLDDHRQWQSVMKETIEKLSEYDLSQSVVVDEQLKELESLSERYNKSFHNLVESTTILGFKDYGLTGEMRTYAHLLEDSFPEIIPLEKVLMLRRHEKDFIIRKEDKYAQKFEELLNLILLNIKSKNQTERTKGAIILLENYQQAFNNIYYYHKKNGLYTHSGLKAELDQNENNLLNYCETLITETKDRASQVLADIKAYFWVMIVLCLILVSVMVNYLSRLLSRPIITLSGHMQAFVESGFTANFINERLETRKDEMGSLYGFFRDLAEEITVHFRNYRDSAERRHKEILRKNEQIEHQKELLESQRNLLAAQNKSVMDSIAYAKRLQRAIFPQESEMQAFLGEFMLLFKPKDVVSGDFYWVTDTPDSIFFAVADCTGHGVPGAFMSLLGYNFLNQAIEEMDLHDTNDILDYLNGSISDLLNQHRDTDEIKDGMDIILCRWIKSEGVLQYSGANRPLLIVRDGEVREYKSDRLPIGWNFTSKRKPFSASELTLEKGDLLILSSDGYYDQFGGVKDKKFKYRNFKSLVSEMNPNDVNYSQGLLESTLQNWMGTTEQVDDICILGVSADHFLEMSTLRNVKTATKERSGNLSGLNNGLRAIS